MQTVNLMQGARAAIRSGNYGEARRAMRQAIRENPDNYHAWLLLARATPSTPAALEYVNRAALLQPDSPLVQRAQLSLEKKANKESAKKRSARKKKIVIFSASTLLLLLMLSLWFGLSAGQSVVTAGSESIFLQGIIPTLPPSGTELNKVSAVFQKPVAPVNNLEKSVPKVEEVPVEEVAESLDSPAVDPVQSSVAKDESVVVVEEISESEVDPAPIEIEEAASSADEIPAAAEMTPEVTQEAVETASEIAAYPVETSEPDFESSADIIALEETLLEEMATTEEIAAIESFPTLEPQSIRPPGVAPYEQWIDVNLTTQTLVAYEGDTPVFNTFISSGLADTPTVTGQFRTYMKYESQDMNGYLLGYDYYLQGVPYVMYFYNHFAIHGTYWHNNFGAPMSHGCVNMNPVDAGWLFSWAPIGTTVNIHH